MEDAFTLVVLTLLQLCRADTTNTEWYAANLVNDPSYTPKPLTEIFTTDLTFIPKNPVNSPQSTPQTVPPTTISTSSSPTTTTSDNRETTTQNQPQRIPLQILGLPQQPQYPQPVIQNDLPSFVFVYDPRQQTNQLFQQPMIPPATTTETSTIPPTTTTLPPSTQSTTRIPIIPGNIQPQTIPFAPPIGSAGINPQRWDIRNLVFPLPNYPIANIGCNSTTRSPVAISTSVAHQTVNPGSGKPVLTVRVKAPKGSKTNIHINPSTTTRKPMTTRRRKANRRRDDYEICLNSCRGKKDPICSSPIGISPIDPDKLKGFASLCHMACHNSYKNDQGYDKVAEGRCGRLRTRIRTVDKNKLNRDELNKAQYTITHNAPETILEFSPLKH